MKHLLSLRSCWVTSDEAILHRSPQKQSARSSRLQVHDVSRREVFLSSSFLALGPGQPISLNANEVLGEVEPQMSTIPIELSIVAAKNALPSHWCRTFQGLVGSYNGVRCKTRSSLDAIYSDLLEGKLSENDLATISNAWLTHLIQEKAILPFEEPSLYSWFDRLPKRWLRYIQRDRNGQPSATGPLWAVPYRWGTTVIAYREQKVRKLGIDRIVDWDDLLHPKLHGQTAWFNSARDLVGLSFKSLGASFNSGMEEGNGGPSLQDVRRRIHDFSSAALLFSNSEHVQALASSDAKVCVGMSSDFDDLQGRISDLKIVLPRSGSAIWADFFVIPAKSGMDEGWYDGGPSLMIHAWLDYALSPSRSAG